MYTIAYLGILLVRLWDCVDAAACVLATLRDVDLRSLLLRCLGHASGRLPCPHVSSFTAVCRWFPSTQLYCKSLRGMGITWIPPHVYPLLLFLGFCFAMVFPWSQRRGMLITIKDSMIAPFALAKFRETFLADVVTSVIKVLVDLVYTFCFFFTGTAHERMCWACVSVCVGMCVCWSLAPNTRVGLTLVL